MLSNFKTKKYCNCSISSNKEILKSSIIYSFCEKCGSVLLKDINNYKNIYYTIKPKQKQNPVELSPIEIINKMKAKTDMDFPFLNNEYNMNDDEKNNQETTAIHFASFKGSVKIIKLLVENGANIYAHAENDENA